MTTSVHFGLHTTARSIHCQHEHLQGNPHRSHLLTASCRVRAAAHVARGLCR
jgi:hypothetical protein